MIKGFNLRIFKLAITAVIMVSILISINEAFAVDTITINMSDHGSGIFNQNYFEDTGIVFTSGNIVELTQGYNALTFDSANGIAGMFTPIGISSISVRFAPRRQGTYEYTLSVFDNLSNIIDSNSVIVTEDLGDPGHSGWGYHTLELSALPGATKFSLYADFLRSSSGSFQNDNNAAMSSMSFTLAPEPISSIFFVTGGALLAGRRLLRMSERGHR